jgi:quinohemoprotein ethanol dehydrogenase
MIASIGSAARIAAVLGLALAPGAAYAQGPLADADLNVDGTRIENADAESGNWLSHGRTYSEQRFSPLKQINDGNIDKLGLAWSYATESPRGHEATPIVVDGAMYFTLPWSVVVSLDAKTGEELWRFDPEVPKAWGRNACCDVVNRGVAIWKGFVFVGALDGRLIALDAKTGQLVWEKLTIDKDRPYTITGAPRVVKDKVIIGNGGAEFGVRGYITAYDAISGDQVWRFYTVPGDPSKPFEHPELEAAAKTWNGEWWKIGGGGTAWDSMAYDPELNLLYVGTGNGSPWNREIRSPGGGDNLYLSSILALNPDTGRLKWHYQTTPADSWDYTATQHIILAELSIGGEMRKVLMQAPKNGFFYVIDRATGELLCVNNYVDINWATHVDMDTGRPIETGEGDYSDTPKLVLPSYSGGHNWHPMAYNPNTKLVYIPTISEPFLYINQKDFEFKPFTSNLGVDFAAAVAFAVQSGAPPPPTAGILKAWDPVSQKEVWSHKYPAKSNGGVLTTAGNLVFQGTGDGRFAAYRADDGEELWEVTTHIGIIAPPISYEVDGEQYVSVLAGWGGVPAILSEVIPKGASAKYANFGHMLSFKIGGEKAMPVVTPKRRGIIPKPPEKPATQPVILKGQALYHTYCTGCHGGLAISSGIISDLRYSSTAVHDNFKKIVLEGVLENAGMAKFDDLLTEEDVEAIHAYIVFRANQDREAQLKAANQ